MGRGIPVFRRVVLPVCLNVVTHVTIDFWSGTGSLGIIMKRFRKVRWVAITDSRFEKLALTANARSSLLQRMIATDCISKETLATHYKKGGYVAAPNISL